MALRYSLKKNLSKIEKAAQEKEWKKADQTIYGAAYGNHIWSQDGVYITAKKNRDFAGFAFLEYEGGVVWLAELLVFEKYRGLGIGKELMERIIEHAKKLKCHKIILETNVEREKAMELYTKSGFKLEARLPNHYANRESILLSKFL